MLLREQKLILGPWDASLQSLKNSALLPLSPAQQDRRTEIAKNIVWSARPGFAFGLCLNRYKTLAHPSLNLSFLICKMWLILQMCKSIVRVSCKENASIKHLVQCLAQSENLLSVQDDTFKNHLRHPQLPYTTHTHTHTHRHPLIPYMLPAFWGLSVQSK